EIEQRGGAGQPIGDVRRQYLLHDSGNVEIFHDALLDVFLNLGVGGQRRERGDEAILLGEYAVRAGESYRQRSCESSEHDEHGPQYSKRGPRWRSSTGVHVARSEERRIGKNSRARLSTY